MRKARRHYRYVRSHPVGKWALAVVWAGVGLMTLTVGAYVPVIRERQDLIDAVFGAEVTA